VKRDDSALNKLIRKRICDIWIYAILQRVCWQLYRK